MINFKIIYKNKKSGDLYESIIDKVLMATRKYYKIYSVSNEDKEVKEQLNKKAGLEVYIIEGNQETTKNIVKEIRINRKETTAFIIIINTNNQDYSDLKEFSLFNLRIIEEYELEKIIRWINRDFDTSNDAIVYTYEGVIYKIPYKDILYIEKIRNSKSSIIKCIDKKEYIINKTLQELETILNEKFIKTHKSAIINLENIKRVDLINKIITFINNESCDFLSRNCKKSLKASMTE